MEVKINIENGQIGETVIDLFKNLSAEKKEELALSVLKEWLLSPELIETRSKEVVVIQEFKDGKYNTNWDKYETKTDEQIRCSRQYQEVLSNYRNSKQILVEEIKNEIVMFYKEQIAKELRENEKILMIRDTAIEEVANNFPSIIQQVMVQVFASNLITLQSSVLTHGYAINQHDFELNSIKNHLSR